MSLSRRLFKTLREMRRAPLPEAVAQAARLHLLDAVGVGLAAAGSSAGAPYLRVASQMARGGRASILGRREAASAADAALVNGGLIHSLEFDDTHTASIVHGSAVLAAAALAVGQDMGASGAAVLGAYARGWEVFARLGLAAPGGFQRQGFQVTSIAGPLVAAMISAEILGLDEDETVAAIGIALSQASGTFEFLSNGSSVKSLHPGWAAHGGVLAARFAQAGMTGPETALEGPHGLFRQYAGDSEAPARLSKLTDGLGTQWLLSDCAFKLQPCCHYLHPFVEAALALRAKGVVADAIETLTCRIALGAAPIVCLPWSARLAAQRHEARWSLPVVTAAAIVEGGVTLETFERPLAPAVVELVARSQWEPLEPNAFPVRFEAELSALCRDGRTVEVRVEDVYGNASRPARRDDVLAKFRGNAARALGLDAVAALEDDLLAFDTGGFERVANSLAGLR